MHILTVIPVYFATDRPSLSLFISKLKKFSDVLLIINDEGDYSLGQNYVVLPETNSGTSGAYNIAIKKYMVQYEYLWLWDQDSSASEDALKTFLERVRECTGLNRCGIFSFYDSKNLIRSSDGILSILDHAKSSGTLIKRTTIEMVGYFDEALFLDYVDYEYIRRASYFGINTVQFDDIALSTHQLGSKFPTLLGNLNAPAPIRLLHQKRGALYIFKLQHFPLSFKIKLLLRILAWVPFSLIFSDRRARLKALWSQ